MYVQLHVPGRSELSACPSDWPEKLCLGSLNVRVAADGYPSLFLERGLSNTVASLDSNCYRANFDIAQDQFGNNKLFPDQSAPRKGSAQVWRAVLGANGRHIPCWVLRRYGSGLINELELLSHEHLRSAYHLEDGQRVTVTLLAGETAV
jgi:hypothetical protein